MTVVFNDLRRETYARVDNVWHMEEEWQKTSSGHLSKFCLCTLEDGKTVRAFQQKHYTIHRVEG